MLPNEKVDAKRKDGNEEIKTMIHKKESGRTFKTQYTDKQIMDWCRWLVENFDE